MNINSQNEFSFLYKYVKRGYNGIPSYIIHFIREYFCIPVDNLIYIDKIKNIQNKNINFNTEIDTFFITLNIKNDPFTIAKIKVINDNSYINIYIHWNKNLNINSNKRKDIINEIKGKIKHESDNYKKLFFLLLAYLINNNSIIVIYEYVYNIIFEFLSHSSTSDQNTLLLNEFINTNNWYELLQRDLINKNFNPLDTCKDMNIELETYLLTIPKIYEHMNKYIIEISNDYIDGEYQNKNKVIQRMNDVSADFERNGEIIFVNNINYRTNNKNNDYIQFINTKCKDEDINNNDLIGYIKNIIINYSHQGVQDDSTIVSAYTNFTVGAIFENKNLNTYFR